MHRMWCGLQQEHSAGVCVSTVNLNVYINPDYLVNDNKETEQTTRQ